MRSTTILILIALGLVISNCAPPIFLKYVDKNDLEIRVSVKKQIKRFEKDIKLYVSFINKSESNIALGTRICLNKDGSIILEDSTRSRCDQTKFIHDRGCQDYAYLTPGDSISQVFPVGLDFIYNMNGEGRYYLWFEHYRYDESGMERYTYCSDTVNIQIIK